MRKPVWWLIVLLIAFALAGLIWQQTRPKPVQVSIKPVVRGHRGKDSGQHSGRNRRGLPPGSAVAEYRWADRGAADPRGRSGGRR